MLSETPESCAGHEPGEMQESKINVEKEREGGRGEAARERKSEREREGRREKRVDGQNAV